MREGPLIFRFAPSPNGELHLGHAFSALLNLKLARNLNGKMLLRIEDIDTERCTPKLEAQMLEDLEWIGFEWDDVPIRQSERLDFYREAINKLEAQNCLYPTTMSRGEIKQYVAAKEAAGENWPRDPDGSPHYPGNERLLDARQLAELKHTNKPYAQRLDMTAAIKSVPDPCAWQEWSIDETTNVKANPQEWGDAILARKNTSTSYHLCCVVDDADQGITHVVRGMDLFHATSIHTLLQQLLDLPSSLYHHHALILDEQGRKLSKSNRNTSLRQLREAGYSKEKIREKLLPNGF